ncbi:uncharacterized protein LOC136086280 isoform X1 [Hydra vulgaris]|uniref:uncharacterized protein LOC136086280 isoform X1 n=1 Tax=Hydra vulgaris TaxID=6087 RepID=UPI0032E9F4F0
MPKESDIWKFFEKSSKFEAKCKICFKSYKINCGSTSTITSHVKTKHEASWKEHLLKTIEILNKQKFKEKETKTTTIESCIIKNQKYGLNDPKQLKFDLDLTKFICKLGLPFEILDNEGAQEFIDEVNSKFTVKSASTFRRQKLPMLYEKVKEGLQIKFLKDFPEVTGVSFTTDLWTSRNNDSYMSLTIHYISSDFSLVIFLIACTPFTGRHTGVAIAVNLDAFIANLNLNEEVHRACVNDNGSNIVLAAKESDEINSELRCNDHTIQLVILKAIKNSIELSKAIKNCTDLASHTHRSALSTTKLQDACEELGIKPRKLIVPCTTRWNSDYMCIKSVLEVKDAIKTLAKTNDEFERSCPSDDQWKTLEYSIPFLEKIYNISVTLSADKRPTIQDVIPELYSLHQELLSHQHHKHKPTRTFIKMLICELQERYPLNGAEQLINCFANFLDPRYKGLHLIEYKKCDEIKEAILTQEKEKKHEKASMSSSKTDNESNENVKVNHHELLRKRLKQDILARSASTMTKLGLEIDHYLAAKIAEETTDILEWWKTMKLQYPILSNYARKYLCIPATSATSERVFSSAGNVVTARRTTLAVENVEKMVYIKENIKKIKINF